MSDAPTEKITPTTPPENTGGVLENLESSAKVVEIVGDAPTENKSQATTHKSTHTHTLPLGKRISQLLFGNKVQTKNLPNVKIQQKRVEKSLNKETLKLLRQVKKIQRSRSFSAHALEKVITQIRHLQSLLEELISATAQRVEELYRHWVLKSV
jgi:hypothetical protein